MTECSMSTTCHNNLSAVPAAKHEATECEVNMNELIFDCSGLSFGKGLRFTLLDVILKDI